MVNRFVFLPYALLHFRSHIWCAEVLKKGLLSQNCADCARDGETAAFSKLDRGQNMPKAQSENQAVYVTVDQIM